MIQIIAGVDEVGVGALAGPVIAAAVILDPAKKIYNLRDSKILTAHKREILYERIMEKALTVSIGRAEVNEIDKLNIFHATMLAMQRALNGLAIKPHLALIDGRSYPQVELSMLAIVKGDRTQKSISAASIIAKVTRDKEMTEHHLQFPEYHFNLHKGYSTKKHQQSISQFGICPIHRRSFRRVKDALNITLK